MGTATTKTHVQRTTPVKAGSASGRRRAAAASVMIATKESATQRQANVKQAQSTTMGTATTKTRVQRTTLVKAGSASGRRRAAAASVMIATKESATQRQANVKQTQSTKMGTATKANRPGLATRKEHASPTESRSQRGQEHGMKRLKALLHILLAFGLASCIDGTLEFGEGTDEYCDPSEPCPGDNQCCLYGECRILTCDGKECGDNGCGGSCGECQDKHECMTSTCCNEELGCGEETGNGQCYSAIQPNYCLIAEECITKGHSHSKNPCLTCSPEKNKFDWTPQSNELDCQTPDGAAGLCKDGTCEVKVCERNCPVGKCGTDDGCGGQCECPPYETCGEDGACSATPQNCPGDPERPYYVCENGVYGDPHYDTPDDCKDLGNTVAIGNCYEIQAGTSCCDNGPFSGADSPAIFTCCNSDGGPYLMKFSCNNGFICGDSKNTPRTPTLICGPEEHLYELELKQGCSWPSERSTGR